MAQDTAFGIVHWGGSPALRPGDGRLKVLVIEDLPEKLLPRSVIDYQEWFSIIVVKDPVQLKKLLDKSLDETASFSGGCYDLPGLPCDIIIADFKLCDRRDEEAPCTSARHENLGMHAPSAGFLMALLTSLWWQHHPQCIIPWTAYEKEFGQIWKLCRKFYPETIEVQWNQQIVKTNASFPEVLAYAVEQYRSALKIAFLGGKMHVPLPEYEKMNSVLAANPDTVCATTPLCCVGEYGRRPMLLGAIFYDKLTSRGTIPTNVVYEWWSELHVGNPTHREAERLARDYWKIRDSAYSEKRYLFGRCLAEYAQSLPGGSPSSLLLDLAADISVDIDLAVTNPSCLNPPEHMSASPLTSVDQSPEIRRLAVLLLCVSAEQYQRKAIVGAQFIDNSLALGKVVTVDQMRDTFDWMSSEEFEKYLEDIRAKKLTIRKREYVRLTELHLCQKEDVFRAIDPLPVTLLTFEQKKSSGKKPTWETDFGHIYNALKRLGIETLSSNWGDLSLDIEDVLFGRPFDELADIL